MTIGMVALDTLELSAFSPLLEQIFVLESGEHRIPLTLSGITSLGHRRPDAKRDPFALAFRGESGLRVSQGIYRLTHATFGTMEIFLTQNADGAQGSEFEAIFN